MFILNTICGQNLFFYTLPSCIIPDSLHNSYSIEILIRKPNEINEIFDDITCEKGF